MLFKDIQSSVFPPSVSAFTANIESCRRFVCSPGLPHEIPCLVMVAFGTVDINCRKGIQFLFDDLERLVLAGGLDYLIFPPGIALVTALSAYDYLWFILAWIHDRFTFGTVINHLNTPFESYS